MGFTPHGIKYPEMSDLPNVPDDIGGLQKLDQTTQAWLSQLDSTNLASLAGLNSQVAAEETSVAAVNGSITTAITRQTAQQAPVNAIQARNDSINTRLTNRDFALGADQSTINGIPGSLSTYTAIKGRGFLGYSAVAPTNIPQNSGFVPFAHYTFNDPAPSSNRVYRATLQCSPYFTYQSPAMIVRTGVVAWAGTAFPGQVTAYVDQYTDPGIFSGPGITLEFTFTGVVASQWTLWAACSSASNFSYTMGSSFSDRGFLLLEDIGLQL